MNERIYFICFIRVQTATHKSKTARQNTRQPANKQAY